MGFFKWLFVATVIVLNIWLAREVITTKGEPCHPAYCTI